MDIYGLRSDAEGKMMDARYLMRREHDKDSIARLRWEEGSYEKLMYMCEGWMGKESPTQYLQDELFELSDYWCRRVRWAIRDLGYRLPGMHHRGY